MSEMENEEMEETAMLEGEEQPKRGRGRPKEQMPSDPLELKMFKLRKKIPADQIEDLEGRDTEGLKRRIVESEMHIHETDQAMKADDDLTSLKAQVKEAQAPYVEAKKAQAMLASYAACLLDKRGES